MTPNELTDLQSLKMIEERILARRAKYKNSIRAKYAHCILFCLAAGFLALHYEHIITITGFLLFLTYGVGIISSLGLLIVFGSEDTPKQDIEKLELEKRLLVNLPSAISTREYFTTLVKINIENLSSNYELVKRHTALSFNASLFFSVVGILLVGTGIVLGIKNQDIKISYLSSASGVIITLVSGLLFALYNKAVIQLKNYHEDMVEVQKVLLSMQIIESEHLPEKTEVIKILIERLMTATDKKNGSKKIA